MNKSVENHYEILGIRPDSNDEQVKQAFRELAKHYHPDRNPGDPEAEHRFKLVNTAYERLKDESRRKSYDQWLAFTQGKRKTSQIQWGRLAAIVLVLFIGPSAVLFGVFMSGGASLFKGPEAQPNIALTAQTEGDSARQGQDAVRKAKADEEKPLERTTADTESADLSDRDEAPADPPETALAEKASRGVADSRLEIAKLSRETPIALPSQEKSEATTAEAPSDSNSSQTADKAVNERDKPVEPPSSDYTQAIPTTKIPKSSEKVAAASSSSAQSQPAGLNDTDRFSGGNDAAYAGEAIESARALARLKEPHGAPAPGEAKTPDPERRTALVRPGYEVPDTFSDCALCPLMSVTRRPAYVHSQTNLAVSLSEITVAQWNLCVNDGACSPYRGTNKEASEPVVGLSRSNASSYAEWLSRITGEQYKIVIPFSVSGNEDNKASDDECGGMNAVRRSSGWDWLEDEPDRECERSAANRSADNGTRGFRVARQIHKDG